MAKKHLFDSNQICKMFHSCQYIVKLNFRIILVWLFPIVLSFAIVLIFSLISTHNVFKISLSANVLSAVLGNTLAFIGTLTAILIAVLTWTYSRSREESGSGFAILREAINGLEIISLQVSQSLPIAPPNVLPGLLQVWVDFTDAITGRLNQITMFWIGLEENETLIEEIHDFANYPVWFFDEQTAYFVATNSIWSQINAESSHRIRDITIGLLRMDIGELDNRLYKDLLKILGSLISLLVIILSLRFISDMPLASSVSGFLNTYWEVLIILWIIAHILWILSSILNWNRKIRAREKDWQSK